MQILTAIVPLPGPPRSHSNRSLVSAQQELAQSFGSGEKLAAIAQRLNMSYSHFRREFRNETGLPPGEYQRRSRLRRARELLATTNLTLKEIAEELGYYSAFHFSSDFKARMGLSPSIWRRRQL